MGIIAIIVKAKILEVKIDIQRGSYPNIEWIISKAHILFFTRDNYLMSSFAIKRALFFCAKNNVGGERV